MSATAIIMTCEKDRALAQLCADGVSEYWPDVTPLVFMDTDHSSEVSLPPDIRDMVRHIPYLRRVFDVPAMSPTEDVYSLDSDCLFFREPVDFGVPAYQGSPGYADSPTGLGVWEFLGHTFPVTRPAFCAGMYSYHRTDFLNKKDLAIEFLRRCRLMELDKDKWPGLVCEQALVAGMWRMAYEDNPLPAARYPINNPTTEQAILHVCTAKRCDAWKSYLKRYKQAKQLLSNTTQ